MLWNLWKHLKTVGLFQWVYGKFPEKKKWCCKKIKIAGLRLNPTRNKRQRKTIIKLQSWFLNQDLKKVFDATCRPKHRQQMMSFGQSKLPDQGGFLESSKMNTCTFRVSSYLRGLGRRNYRWKGLIWVQSFTILIWPSGFGSFLKLKDLRRRN